MPFWRKQRDIEKMLASYFELCDNCFDLFDQAFTTYVEKGQSPAFEKIVQEVHLAESTADDLRRDIELTLYGKALLPESRGDLLGLLETFDKLPNMAETVLFAMFCQKTVLPPNLLPRFQHLVKLNIEAYHLVRKAVDDLMHNPRATLHATKAVDDKESESDRAERDLICQIFSMESITPGTMLLLKELVRMIGKISNRAETAADRIGIVAIKRQI